MTSHDSGNEDEDLKNITEPRDSDVLCGRGGAALRHAGNQTYRRLVNLNKQLYITCLKTEKLKISRSIVAAIREQNGRFLERDAKKGVWYDIGDKKAIEKTSQALREGQPKLRKKMVEMGQIPPDQVGVGMNEPVPGSVQQQSIDQYGNGVYNPRNVHPSMNNFMNGGMGASMNGGMNNGMNMNMDMNNGLNMNNSLNMNMNMNMNGGMMNFNMNNGTNMNNGMNMNNNSMNNLGRDGSGNFRSSDMLEFMQQQQQNYTLNMARNHMGRNNTGNLRNNMAQMPPPNPRDPTDDADGEPDLTMLRHLSLESNPQSIPSWTPSMGSGDSFMGMSITTDVPEMVNSRNRMRSTNRNSSSVPFANRGNSSNNATNMSDTPHNNGRSGNRNQSCQVTEPTFTREKMESFEVAEGLYRQHIQQLSGSDGHSDENTNENKVEKKKSAPTVNDRRRIFARMKHPAKGSTRSINDGMPDIHMVDSQFSLLSNLSAHGSKHNAQNATDMAISTHRGGKKDSMGSEYIGVGSRRSLMSGMSRMSTHSDEIKDTFGNIGKRVVGITNHTMSSRSLLSEFSGGDEFAEDELKEEFNFEIPKQRTH